MTVEKGLSKIRAGSGADGRGLRAIATWEPTARIEVFHRFFWTVTWPV